jgi:hypothetical protein
MRFQPARYSSPHFFAIPYGDSGRKGVFSSARSEHSPYPAPPDDAKITCAPAAACSTFTVPTTLTAAS